MVPVTAPARLWWRRLTSCGPLVAVLPTAAITVSIAADVAGAVWRAAFGAPMPPDLVVAMLAVALGAALGIALGWRLRDRAIAQRWIAAHTLAAAVLLEAGALLVFVGWGAIEALAELVGPDAQAVPAAAAAIMMALAAGAGTLGLRLGAENTRRRDAVAGQQRP
jgi:hypothetical protein